MKSSLRKMILTIAGASAVGLALTSCSAGAGSGAAEVPESASLGASVPSDEVGTSGQRYIPNAEVPAPVDRSISGAVSSAAGGKVQSGLQLVLNITNFNN